jgi:nucleoid DNA-binding protein
MNVPGVQGGQNNIGHVDLKPTNRLACGQSGSSQYPDLPCNFPGKTRSFFSFLFFISSLDIEDKGVIPGNVIEIFTPTHNFMTLTKRDLVIRISTETDIPQQQVLEVVQRTLDYISESLAKGNNVELRNFGVFEVKVRKARIGRNPNAPATDVPIPERSVVKFKPGKEMRAEVIKLPPEVILSKKKEKNNTPSEPV